MSDAAELQAKIAALAGKINEHKQQPTAPATHSPLHATYHENRASNRWTPYGYAARGGRPARGVYHGTHKNRTLVLGGAQAGQSTPLEQDIASTPPAKGSESFVSARRTGMNQLMTKDTYERELQQKMVQHDRPTRRTTPKQHAPSTQSTTQLRIMELAGIKFKVANDGSKLFRVPDSATADQETPKKVKVTGVDFVRTKHGNLLKMKTANEAKRYHATYPSENKQSQLTRHDSAQQQKPQCENFTKYGTCPFGPGCKFTHDPTKVAICKEWLRNGWCKAGDNCDMSHESSYHRVSACTHFLRGNCSNTACRYPHINISPSAPVCRSFATLGYCAKGEKCDRRHVFECPDYTNHGHCADREKGKCQLPHIDRAGTLRKAAKRQAKTGSEDESDISSDEEDDDRSSRVVINDEDSDGPEDEDVGHGDAFAPMILDNPSSANHAVTEQDDFISFAR